MIRSAVNDQQMEVIREKELESEKKKWERRRLNNDSPVPDQDSYQFCLPYPREYLPISPYLEGSLLGSEAHDGFLPSQTEHRILGR